MAAENCLHEMTTEEFGELFPVILQPYDPMWADMLIEVANSMDNQRLKQKFTSKGYDYIYKPENPAPHMMFVKVYTKQGASGKFIMLT